MFETSGVGRMVERTRISGETCHARVRFYRAGVTWIVEAYIEDATDRDLVAGQRWAYSEWSRGVRGLEAALIWARVTVEELDARYALAKYANGGQPCNE